MKVRKVATANELDAILDSTASAASRAIEQLSRLRAGNEALRSLWQMKVEAVGCDPLNSDSPLNLIEQINQTFTYVASVRAARKLFELHPSAAPFTLNLGTSAGSDIESAKDGGVAAEVFAAVHTSSNRKLVRDQTKVGATTARFKYVFFMCPGIDSGRHLGLERIAGVQVWSVGGTI